MVLLVDSMNEMTRNKPFFFLWLPPLLFFFAHAGVPAARARVNYSVFSLSSTLFLLTISSIFTHSFNGIHLSRIIKKRSERAESNKKKKGTRVGVTRDFSSGIKVDVVMEIRVAYDA